ncbi:pyridoxal-phosphate dependent enzyme [Seonamhaeicola marinus]|uniref:Pyridoxal-phosphate dependent enzyme n=1 Tax=Seonamhaeicola marinus TaxID=1912246 RepID=A0A5D0HWU0_9FLAO|nr:pyridoxal-phosphate dependent enzyme [Seonamhaeicola marinus]TYA74989.1 pyridoxal-phosphate dependent enzyme [Seonamhaeicola marinus]
MTKEDLLKVHEQIKPYVHNTPVLTSQLINKMCNADLFFKCENFQKMGAFKMRGATNAILNLSKEEKEKGVVTHSSGNFAQALALAAKSVGVKAYIAMPENAPQVKKDAVSGYGGIITECGVTATEREAAAQKIQEETGAVYLHPSNNDDVIHGQGTAAMELIEEHPDLDFLFIPVGGGGLIAGSLLAVNAFAKKCKVIGGEPKHTDDAFRSLKSGKIEFNSKTNTIADGLRMHLGDRNFPIIKEYIEKIVLVEEEEIIEAMKLIWERMKIVIEPSSAVAFAALLKSKDTIENKKIGVIISGGNVDVSNLPF